MVTLMRSRQDGASGRWDGSGVFLLACSVATGSLSVAVPTDQRPHSPFVHNDGTAGPLDAPTVTHWALGGVVGEKHLAGLPLGESTVRVGCGSYWEPMGYERRHRKP